MLCHGAEATKGSGPTRKASTSLHSLAKRTQIHRWQLRKLYEQNKARGLVFTGRRWDLQPRPPLAPVLCEPPRSCGMSLGWPSQRTPNNPPTPVEQGADIWEMINNPEDLSIYSRLLTMTYFYNTCLGARKWQDGKSHSPNKWRVCRPSSFRLQQGLPRAEKESRGASALRFSKMSFKVLLFRGGSSFLFYFFSFKQPIFSVC